MGKDADQKQNETEIFFAKRDIEIGGETVTVREFTFIEEARALPIAEPIIKEIAERFSEGEDPDLLAIERIFVTHLERMLELLSISTGKPIEWFEKITGDQGSSIYLTFWGVNSHFFTRRVATQYLLNHPAAKKDTAPI